MGLDALGLALVYSMGHANLDQELARFVPRVDIGLVGAEPAFQLHLVQRRLPRRVIDPASDMDMPIGIAGLGRVWHFHPVPVTCRNPPFPPLGNQLLGPERSTRLAPRSEEHTSELQSLMRISYAVFCLKKKTQ